MGFPTFACCLASLGSWIPEAMNAVCVNPEQSLPFDEFPPQRYGTPFMDSALEITMLIWSVKSLSWVISSISCFSMNPTLPSGRITSLQSTKSLVMYNRLFSTPSLMGMLDIFGSE